MNKYILAFFNFFNLKEKRIWNFPTPCLLIMFFCASFLSITVTLYLYENLSYYFLDKETIQLLFFNDFVITFKKISTFIINLIAPFVVFILPSSSTNYLTEGCFKILLLGAGCVFFFISPFLAEKIAHSIPNKYIRVPSLLFSFIILALFLMPFIIVFTIIYILGFSLANNGEKEDLRIKYQREANKYWRSTHASNFSFGRVWNPPFGKLW